MSKIIKNVNYIYNKYYLNYLLCKILHLSLLIKACNILLVKDMNYLGVIMLISLKEYKLLKYGKTTFYPGKFKILVNKQRVEQLKEVAIYDETNYFNKSWLDVELDYQKEPTLNMSIAKLQTYKSLYSTNPWKAKAQIISLSNALSELCTVIRYAEDILVCIYKSENQQNLEYLLCTQNYLKYKMLNNTKRSEAKEILTTEVPKLNDNIIKCEPKHKHRVYLDPKIINYIPEYPKIEEWEKE